MSELLKRDRPGSTTSREIQTSEFPLQVFNFSNPQRDLTPVLSMKEPWTFQLSWIKRGKVLNTGATQTITFAEEFVDIPIVTAQCLRSSSGTKCFADITAVTVAGFDVSLVNHDGTVHIDLTDYIMWTAIL